MSFLRRAKSIAAQCGIALRALVTEAVKKKPAAASSANQKPCLRLAGGPKHLHAETMRIDGNIRSEFEKIEPEGEK